MTRWAQCQLIGSHSSAVVGKVTVVRELMKTNLQHLFLYLDLYYIFLFFILILLLTRILIQCQRYWFFAGLSLFYMQTGVLRRCQFI